MRKGRARRECCPPGPQDELTSLAGALEPLLAASLVAVGGSY